MLVMMMMAFWGNFNCLFMKFRVLFTSALEELLLLLLLLLHTAPYDPNLSDPNELPLFFPLALASRSILRSSCS